MNPEWTHRLAVAQSEVKRTLKALPGRLRQETRHLPITYEHRPDSAMQADGIEEDSLGLFVGEAFPDQEQISPTLPPQVLLFLDNIWDFAEGNEEAYRREIRTTLLHELGHYLGLDELDLEARGLE